MKVKNWVRVTYSIPVEVDELLRRESARTDRKLSIIVTRALIEYIKEEKNESRE